MLILSGAADSSAGTSSGAAFLRIGVGARALAMGEAYTAVADDANAAYWNPAGLMQIPQPQLSLVHNEMIESTHNEYISFCQPFRGWALAVSGTYLWIEGIEGRSGNTETADRTIPAWDAAAGVSGAVMITERISGGITLKGVQQQLDDRSATGFAFDCGALYFIDDDGAAKIGLAVQNLGSMTAFVSEAGPLPVQYRLGVSNEYREGKLTAALDGTYNSVDDIWSAGAGADWRILPFLALRLGYRYDSAMTTLGAFTGMSGGLGFRMKMFDIDYAFVPYGDLGYTNRLSVLVRL